MFNLTMMYKFIVRYGTILMVTCHMITCGGLLEEISIWFEAQMDNLNNCKTLIN
jgi:hypothetical protein